MKKYIIFAISFILLFSLFQFLSGMLLTSMYTPDIEKAWSLSGNLSQEVIINNNHSPFLLTLIAFLSATIAYFIPKKISNNNKSIK